MGKLRRCYSKSSAVARGASIPSHPYFGVITSRPLTSGRQPVPQKPRLPQRNQNKA